MIFTRGDNKSYRFVRKTTDGNIIKEPVVEMYLTVKKNSDTEDYLIQKKLSDGDILFDSSSGYYKIEFLPEDTNDLPYGRGYIYDIQIKYEQDGKIKTKTLIVDELELTKEVTFASNE